MVFTPQIKLIRTVRLWVFFVLCSIAYYLLKHKEILLFHRNKRSNTLQTSHDEEIEYFRTLWKLQRERRFDFNALMEPCKDDMKWKSFYPEKNASFITSAKTTKVELDIRQTGQYSRVLIHSFSLLRTPKHVGGDTWRIFIRGAASMPVTVLDHLNGTYEAFFLVTTPGKYHVELHLEYTLCDGYKDPPQQWFVRGNEQGKSQPDHMLPGYEKAYVEEKFDGDLSFVVVDGHRNIFKELSAQLVEEGEEETSCLMWDGFGEWNDQLQWTPLIKNPFQKSSLQKKVEGRGVFWIYGDSVGDFFYRAVWNTPLCKILFITCKRTYNWVYNLPNNAPPRLTSTTLTYDNRDFDIERLVHEIVNVISHPPMDDESALLLNLGLHYVMGIPVNQFIELMKRVGEILQQNNLYNSTIIWKTTTALQKWKYGAPESNARHAKSHRFLTQQRVEIFNAISTNILCQAGVPILDVFPMSYSYPNGTGSLAKPWDAVHYSRKAFIPVEQYLFSFFKRKT